MNKTLTRIEVYYRDPMDPEVPLRVCTVDLPCVGDARVTLTKDDAGNVIHEASVIQPNEEFRQSREDLKNAMLGLRRSITESQFHVQAVVSELLGVSKYLRDE